MSTLWRPNGRTPRAISLTRVSRDPKYESTSHDTQHAGNLRCISELGAVLYKHYEETISGALYLAREETQMALEDLENDRADYLILYDMTRYGRSVRWQQEILHRVECAGKRIQFATFRLDYDERENRLTFYSRSAFNTFGNASETERYMIRERMMRGRKAKVDMGIMVARTVSPYGYHVVKHLDVLLGRYPVEMTGRYVLIEEQARVVRLIFEMYDQGYSLRALASYLTGEGIPTPLGGLHWRVPSIQHILQNPVYKGKPAYGKMQRFVDERRQERGLSYEYEKARPESEWIYLEAPATVSEELWERCNDRRRRARAESSGRTDRKHMLTGLLRCPVCGRRLYGRTTCGYLNRARRAAGEKATQNINYRCSGAIKRENSARKTCEMPTFGGSKLQSLVMEAVLYLLHRPALLAAAEGEYSQRRQREGGLQRDEQQIKRLEQEIATLARREREAAALVLEARLAKSEGTPKSDGAAFEQLRREAEDRRIALEKQLAEIKARLTQATLQNSELLENGAVEEIEAALLSPDILPARKGLLLARFVERIYPALLPEEFQGSARQMRIRNGKQKGRVMTKEEIEGSGARRLLGGVNIVLRVPRPGPCYILSHVVSGRIATKDSHQRDTYRFEYSTTLRVEEDDPFPLDNSRRSPLEDELNLPS